MPVIQLDQNYQEPEGTPRPVWGRKIVNSKSKSIATKTILPKFEVLEQPWTPSEVKYDPETDFGKYSLYNTSQNLFVTGKAGTGKSTMLRELVDYCKQNGINCAVVAPTGIAAINVGGSTIHSLFQIDIHNPTNLKKLNPVKRSLLKAIQVLIIDEISMVSDTILDLIDKRMNQAKFGENPHSKRFGGARLILFGDIFQLGPVSKDNEAPVGYFFESDVFAQMYNKGNLEMLELTKIWRQDEPEFISLLNKIRTNSAVNSDFDLLNNKVLTESPDVFAKQNNFSILCTTNNQVNYYNAKILATIDSPAHQFKGQLTGEFTHYDGLPSTEMLLKKGCLVVLVRNDVNKKYVNGDFGIVKDFKYRVVATKGNVERIKIYEGDQINTDKIKSDIAITKADNFEISLSGYVLEIELTRTGETVLVPKENWERKQYEIAEELVEQDGEKVIKQTLKDKTVGVYTQFPVKVGYALTVHKSQGMTLEGAVLDFAAGTFGSGLAYVAFSRVKSLKNLYLTSPIDASIVKLDPKISGFFASGTVSDGLI
jgi:ATP-dependent DNA helicase PIF1